MLQLPHVGLRIPMKMPRLPGIVLSASLKELVCCGGAKAEESTWVSGYIVNVSTTQTITRFSSPKWSVPSYDPGGYPLPNLAEHLSFTQ